MSTTVYSPVNVLNYRKDDIFRTHKIIHDIRREKSNERITIFEVVKFKEYTLTWLKDGETKAILTAQNALNLLLTFTRLTDEV